MSEYSNYIPWQEISVEKLLPSEFNELIKKLNIKDYLKNKNKHDLTIAPTVASYYREKMFVSTFGNTLTFHVVDKVHEPVYNSKGKYMFDNIVDVPRRIQVHNQEDSGLCSLTGSEAFGRIVKDFYSKYGVTFDAAFGSDIMGFTKSSSKETVQKERNKGYVSLEGLATQTTKYYTKVTTVEHTLVPSPINFGAFSLDKYYGVKKMDICSAYAFEASKTLPHFDIFKCKIVDGYAEPTEQLPFAFYKVKNSITYKPKCLVAIYGENIRCSEKPEDVVETLLLPASKYSLKPIFEQYYYEKEHAMDEAAKLRAKAFMNFFIGFCQCNTDPKYAHLSAVIIARCNARIRSVMHEIYRRYGTVILVNTDSIAWIGPDMPQLYTTKKALGNFLLEYKDVTMYVKGPKAYQILDHDGTLKTVCAGVTADIKAKMKFGDILDEHKFTRTVYVYNIAEFKYEEKRIDEFNNFVKNKKEDKNYDKVDR